MKNNEELRLAICLAKLDGLQPWNQSKDLKHCWESFPWQQSAYKPGKCGGKLQVWEGTQSDWIGRFIVICEKHAQDSSFRQAWKQRELTKGEQ